MDVSEMITEIDDHGFGDLLSDSKVGVINDTIWDVCSREGWPFLETATTSVTVDSSGKITSPTDISKIISLVNQTDGYSLIPERREYLDKVSGGDLSQTNDPRYYYRLGADFYIFPISTTKVLSIAYVKVPVAVTAASLETAIPIPIRHQRLIVLGALAKLYYREDDPELGALFDEQMEARIANMREDMWKWNFDRPDRIYVIDEDDWMLS